MQEKAVPLFGVKNYQAYTELGEGKQRYLRGLLGVLSFLCLVWSGNCQYWMKGGHGWGVWQVVFSTDRRYLLSAAGDNTIKVWDANPFSSRFGKLIASVNARHVTGVYTLAESNGYVVSGGSVWGRARRTLFDNRVKLWRLHTNGRLTLSDTWLVPGGYGISSLSFVSWLVNGTPRKVVVAGTYEALFLIDINTGATRWHPLPGSGWILAITSSRNAPEFAIGTEQGRAYVFRPEQEISIPIALPQVSGVLQRSSPITALQYDLTESYLLVGEKDWLTGWNVSNGQIVFQQSNPGYIASICVYKGSAVEPQYIATAGGDIRTFAWQTGSNSVNPCGQISASANCANIATDPFTGVPYLYAIGEGSSIKWWSVSNACCSEWEPLPSPTTYFLPLNAAILSVSFSHDDEFIAVGLQGKAHVWRRPRGSILEYNELIWELQWESRWDAPFVSVRFSPTEHRLVVAHLGQVKSFLWNGESFNLSWDKWLFDRPTGGIVFSPDGSRLLVTEGSRWEILNSTNGQVIFSRDEVVGSTPTRIISCAWSPDGQYFAVGRVDGKVRIYRAESSLLYAQFRVGSFMNPSAIAFSHVGGRLKLFIGTTTGKLQQWDVLNATKEWEETIHSEWISSLHARDGWVVTSSTGTPDSLSIWRNGTLQGSIFQETGTGVHDAAFSSQWYIDIRGSFYLLAYVREDATLVVIPYYHSFRPPDFLWHRIEKEVSTKDGGVSK